MTLLVVGRLKEAWARDAAVQYEQRIRPHARLQVLELVASRGRTPSQQQAEESDRVLRMLQKMEGEKWILDERGIALPSMQFAAHLSRAREAGVPIIFAVGGAYGFTDAVRRSGHKLLRLSDMTLPHELARVVLLEQLYRALDINHGGAYHH